MRTFSSPAPSWRLTPLPLCTPYTHHSPPVERNSQTRQPGLQVDTRPRLNEQLDHTLLPILRREVQACVPIIVLGIDGAPLGKRVLDQLLVPVLRREVQQRLPVLVRHADVGAVLDEEAHDALVAAARGLVQGRPVAGAHEAHGLGARVFIAAGGGGRGLAVGALVGGVSLGAIWNVGVWGECLLGL